MTYVFDDHVMLEAAGWVMVPYSDLEFAKLELKLGGRVCLVFTPEECKRLMRAQTFPLQPGTSNNLIVRVNIPGAFQVGSTTDKLFRHLVEICK